MPTTPPPINPSPQVPQRGVKATFSNLVDAFNTWLALAVAQFGAVATNVFNNATEAFNSAVAALGSANTAADRAAAASASATSAYNSVIDAAAVNGAAPWVAGTTYQQFDRALSRISFKAYRKATTAAANTGGVTDPANDPVNWRPTSEAAMPRSGRTANVMIVDRDRGSLIDITAGTFTQTFAAAATLIDGWFAYLRNSGTGDITLDPAGAELIDGKTSYVMYPGETRLVMCDGVSLRSVVMASFYRVFASSAQFVNPPGYVAFGTMAWAGAGSGGAWRAGSGSSAHVSGSSTGGFASAQIPAAHVDETTSIVIGAGGAEVTATADGTGANGIAGGSTSFGSHILVTGGAGGVANNFPTSAVPGGTSTDIVLAGGIEAGSQGGNSSNSGAGSSASKKYAGTGGAGVTSVPSNFYTGTVGNSSFGGKGGTSNTSATVSDATAGAIPGGGGGSCATRGVTAVGKAGARGEFRIWGVI